MTPNTSAPPSPPLPPIRIFQSMIAAETAYREQVALNETLGAKIDNLGATLGGKLDTMTSLLERLLNKLGDSTTTQTTPPPFDENVRIPVEPFKRERSLPFPSGDARNYESVIGSSQNTQHTPPPPLSSFSGGLRELQLPRSQSGIAGDKPLQHSPRRPIRPPQVPESEILSYRGLPGSRPPYFYGRYTENATTWLETIEDRFFLSQTPDKYKVASISSQLKGVAGQWYSDIRKEYGRRPTWEEFKDEIQKKFVDSAIRTTYLRFTLKSISYSGPQDMENYIANFRNIELQISREDMSFGDRLEYFLGPFDIRLKRRIKNEHHSKMESVYNAAQEWAMAYIDTLEGEKRKELMLSKPIKQTIDSESSSTSAVATALNAIAQNIKRKQVSDSDDTDDDEINTIRSNPICNRCQRPGHFARDCTAPAPVPSGKQSRSTRFMSPETQRPNDQLRTMYGIEEHPLGIFATEEAAHKYGYYGESDTDEDFLEKYDVINRGFESDSAMDL